MGLGLNGIDLSPQVSLAVSVVTNRTGEGPSSYRWIDQATLYFWRTLPCNSITDLLASCAVSTFAPVPGSPTPRELAVADGSVRKYRIGPWSLWGGKTWLLSSTRRPSTPPAARRTTLEESTAQSRQHSPFVHSPGTQREHPAERSAPQER